MKKVGFRLITTGLDSSVNDVIGYSLYMGKQCDPIHKLVKAKDSTMYSAEAMMLNGLTIAELDDIADGRENLKILLDSINNKTVVIWYKPFIKDFIDKVSKELDYDLNCEFIDLWEIAKNKKLPLTSFALLNVIHYLVNDPILKHNLDYELRWARKGDILMLEEALNKIDDNTSVERF